MWATFIPAAIAAAIIASMVNLGSEINNIRTARQGVPNEAALQRDASAWGEMQLSPGSSAQQKTNVQPGA